MDIDIVQQHLAKSSLKDTRSKIGNPREKQQDETRLKEACAGFEAIFINTMLKNMRNSLPGDAVFPESNGSSIYKSMYDQYLSEHLAGGRSSIGIGEFLFEQLKDSI